MAPIEIPIMPATERAAVDDGNDEGAGGGGGTGEGVGGGAGAGLMLASSSTRRETLGVPHPVIASQPTEALKPYQGKLEKASTTLKYNKKNTWPGQQTFSLHPLFPSTMS